MSVRCSLSRLSAAEVLDLEQRVARTAPSLWASNLCLYGMDSMLGLAMMNPDASPRLRHVSWRLHNLQTMFQTELPEKEQADQETEQASRYAALLQLLENS
jgi:hypothetical protein